MPGGVGGARASLASTRFCAGAGRAHNAKGGPYRDWHYRVSPAHRCAGLPSEPCERLSPHTAQAAQRLSGGQKCWAFARVGGMPGVAVGVDETAVGYVGGVELPHGGLDDRRAGGVQPLLPLAWALRLLIDGQEPVPADRAAAILGFEELQVGFGDRWGWGPASSPAQYSSSVGSSGDARWRTIWWRTMLVQQKRCM